MTALPAHIDTARLPETYERARAALAECSQIDECQSWADKAAAMASYARQAKDDQLERLAQRIRARAIRRAGELLAQVEPQRGARTDIEHGGGAPTKLTRKQAATDAGMSRDQMHTALRVARVPAPEFEAAVEADKPLTLSELAAKGIAPRPAPPKPSVDIGQRTPKQFNAAMHFEGWIMRVSKEAAEQPLSDALPALTDGERRNVRAAVEALDRFLDSIITRI